MPAWGWMLVTAAVMAAAAASLWSVRTRRTLAAARGEAEQLREMVKKRVERPNVFSHEVRTPLALVAGAAELLAEETPGPLNDRQREFVRTIVVNARQAIGFAEDMLTEARIDAQLFELHLDEVDLRALVRQTARDARRVHPNPVRLENQGPPLPLMADRTLLGQALWNLVNNACRHAGADASVTLSVTEGESQAILAVTDDGEGMSADERKRLFEPFATGASQRSGTGLGMMITERIVAQHSGRLLVDSAPGGGTTVFVILPLARGEGDHD